MVAPVTRGNAIMKKFHLTMTTCRLDDIKTEAMFSKRHFSRYQVSEAIC